MIIHIPTGIQFDNRLKAKLFFGSSEYNRRNTAKEFTFHDDRHKNNIKQPTIK